MAYEIPLLVVPFTAGADLSDKQYYFVKLSAGAAVPCAAVTDKPIGVLQNAPPNGGQASVMMIGITKVSSDAAIAADALIGTSADGQAATKTPGTDTTHYIAGRCIEATTAAGGLATAAINCASLARAA